MSGLDPMMVLMQLVILLFAVVVHEFAHGYVALRLGDPTAENAGRLTFNPIPHIDPMMTIIMPLMLLIMSQGQVVFGGAKPVPINPGYFRHPRRDNILVSIAGVTANLLIATIAGLVFRLLAPMGSVGLFLEMTCFINVLLAVFNMVPIPPLDGSHVVAALLPPEMARAYGKIAPFGFVILIFLLYAGLLRVIVGSVVLGVARLLLGL